MAESEKAVDEKGKNKLISLHFLFDDKIHDIPYW